MRSFIAAVVLPLLAGRSSLAGAPAQAEEAQLERLSWLAGCWAAERGEQVKRVPCDPAKAP